MNPILFPVGYENPAGERSGGFGKLTKRVSSGIRDFRIHETNMLQKIKFQMKTQTCEFYPALKDQGITDKTIKQSAINDFSDFLAEKN